MEQGRVLIFAGLVCALVLLALLAISADTTTNIIPDVAAKTQAAQP
jgi:hypothetical protein